MGDWIDFAEVRSKVSLEEVLIGMYGLGDRLKRHGKKLIGPCPIHNGDGPRAFQADLEKQVFFCFSGCRRGGNALDLVAALDGITIREAALKLRAAYLDAPGVPTRLPAPPPARTSAPASNVGVVSASPARAPPERSPQTRSPEAEATRAEEAAPNPPLSLRLTLAHDHPHLLKERGLSLETTARFGVGYCARGLLRGTIAIPIRDEGGELVAYAGRRLKGADIREKGKYAFPRGFRKELVLYNLDRAQQLAKEEGLVLLEGFFGSMTLFERGLANAVASMGCALSEAQADLLAEHAKHVSILYDGDDSGRGGALEAQLRLDARGVASTIIRLPDGWKPEQAPARLLRWATQGARLLSLRELAFSPQAASEGGQAAAS